jgi:hypothetical protein
MMNDNENQEALELKPMINNDTQNDAESFTEEAALVYNALENEVFVGGLRREELLHRYVCRLQMTHNIFLYHYL